MLQLKGALGFLIEQGGSNSHTAILARSMNIASVVGAASASKLIRDDDTLILDGDAGVVIVNPDDFVLREYRERQQRAQAESQKLGRLINVPEHHARWSPHPAHGEHRAAGGGCSRRCAWARQASACSAPSSCS